MFDEHSPDHPEVEIADELQGAFRLRGLFWRGADLASLMAKKAQTVSSLTKGIDFLFRKNGVMRLKGKAAFTGPGSVQIDGKEVMAKSIVIATGSVPTSLPGACVDNENGIIEDSTGALSLPRIPGTLAVVGGGAIGLELGSVWRRLGSEVTVIEHTDQVLPGMDEDIRSTMAKILAKRGMTIAVASSVTSVESKDGKAVMTVVDAFGPKALEFHTVLVATGRRPNTEGLGLDRVGIVVDERGVIPVDHAGHTSVAGVYAIGDVTRGAMLAHRAEDEGVAVAEGLAGRPGIVNHELIPSVVYTHPEVASVGRTERELSASGVPHKEGDVPDAGQ